MGLPESAGAVVWIGQFELAELDDVRPAVLGDVQAVVRVRLGIRHRVDVCLPALVEGLPGLRVDGGPRAAVVRTLQLPVGRVAAGLVVAGGERVLVDRARRVQLRGEYNSEATFAQLLTSPRSPTLDCRAPSDSTS